jgi:Arm DNA-binding domain
MKTFQARIRRQGETNPRRVRIGSFPTISVADARRKLVEMKSLAREGQDPTLEQRRALRRGQDSNSVGPDQRTPRPAGGRRCSSQESETSTYFDKLFQIEFGAVFSYLGGLVISIKPTKILFFPQS